MPEGLTQLPPEAEEFVAPLTGERPVEPVEERRAPSPEIERPPYHFSEKDYKRFREFAEKKELGELSETELEMYAIMCELADTAAGRFRDELTGMNNRAAWNKEVEYQRRMEQTTDQETYVFVI